jgi:D-methionine transport system ATP-binding protein
MIELKNIFKTYYLDNKEVNALVDASININDKDIYGIIGYSGAGKSTIVRTINLLEKPDSGEVIINGKKLCFSNQIMKKGNIVEKMHFLKGHELRDIRKNIGMIFQHFNLLDRLTVFDNVAFPLKYNNISKKEIEERVLYLLDMVGLRDKINAYPQELSGGQKQRVSIARALANNPKILLSDEATSALDPEATESILNLLKKINKELGVTIVVITHEMDVIKQICNNVSVMEKGRVVEEGSVYDIFANPKAAITKKFISRTNQFGDIDRLVEKYSNLSENEELLHLSFNDKCVKESIISYISKEFDVDVNILSANIEIISGRPLGEMLVGLKGENTNMQKTLKYLEEENVSYTYLFKEGL